MKNLIDKKLLLIDAKNVLYRMHFPHARLANSEGVPTGAMFGFLQEVLRFAREWPGAHMVFVWDGPGKGWRKKLFPEVGYKGNRRKDNLDTIKVHQQENILRPLIAELGFCTGWITGVEADDILGVLAGELRNEKGTEVRIYSGDKDMLQLVGGSVSVWQAWKAAPVGVNQVKKWLGVDPESIPEIRAMAGDPSDNLRGLLKVGPKKALQLFREGVRASSSYSSMKPTAQVATLKWKGEWDRIQQEFLLTMLPTSPVESCFDEKQREELKALVEEIKNNPERKNRKGQQVQWLEFLGIYEMKDLWSQRNKIWRI